MNTPWLKSSLNTVTLSVKVQPRAASNSISNTSGQELHVRIAAPPTDDRANTELVSFFSKILGCPKSSVRIRLGHKSRHKVLEIAGINAETVIARVLDAAS